MIIAELVSLLGFKVDNSGARQFDANMNALAQKSNAVAAGISAAFANAALNMVSNLTGAITSGIAEIPKAGDAMNTSLAKIETSIGRSATSADEAAAIYDKLFEASQRTGVSADESAAGFVRFNLAMQEVGRPAEDTIKLIEGIQAAGIVAGTTTTELTASMLQLGQALGSGKLQGDELKSLRENMPTLLRDLVKELGTTQKQFFEDATKGLLTPEKIIPALLKAGETASKELANFPVTMGRAYSILTASVTRFLAELDKQLNLSKTIASVFVYIAQTLNSWRSGLSVIGDFIRELGSMQDILQLIAISMLVAFGIGPLLSLIKVLDLVMAAFLRAFWPLTLFTLFVLAIDDFVGWIQGKHSLLGEMFGDFDTIIGPWKPKLEEMKSWFEANFNFTQLVDNTKREFASIVEFFTSTWESIKNTWNSNITGMKPQFDWLVGAAGLLKTAWEPIAEFFVGVFNVIIKNIGAFYDKVVAVIGGIKSAASSLLNILPGLDGAGAGAASDPTGQERRRKNFGGRGAMGGFVNPDLLNDLSQLSRPMPDVSGRVGTGTNTVNAPQTNTIENNISITAPGADPASVAAGVNTGLGRATDNMTTRLGNSLALVLGISSPRVEAPAAP